MKIFSDENNYLARIFILLCAILFVYYPSISVPFYLDDIYSVEQNLLLKTGNISELFAHYHLRFVTYFTFWLDFKISDSIAQHHYTNIAIHLLSSLAVYFFIHKLIKIVFPEYKYAKLLAFLATTIFALHPIQTQAVTYIIQRTASLVALFYIIALTAYLKARTSTSRPSSIGYFVLFGLFCAIALFTKQNAFTIFAVVLLIELLIVKGIRASTLFKACLATCIALVLFYFVQPDQTLLLINKLDAATKENDIYTRWQYFTAQLNILWVYIGKVIWPVHLRLEYGYEITHFSTAQTVFSSLGHIVLITSAYLCRKKLPLFLFGILFFYITHLVESSVIPIKDLAFEHRMYLPITGLIIAIVSLIILINSKKGIKITGTGFVLIAVLLSYLTYERNTKWQNPISFYQNELSYLPNSCRVLNNLAVEYYKADKRAKGNVYLKRCLESSNGNMANFEMINNLLAMLIDEGKYQQADKIGKKALANFKGNPIFKRRILENMGILQMKLDNLASAESYFKQALKLPAPLPKTFFALSVVLAKQQKFKEAYTIVVEGLKREPNNRRGQIILSRLRPLVNQ